MKVLAVLLALLMAGAGSPRQTVTKTRAWREKHERAIVSELMALLDVPNVSSDLPSLRMNANRLVAMFGRRGFNARTVETRGGAPVVVAELVSTGATKTVGLYAHYDGQPVNPAEWASPPFDPTFRDAPLDDLGSRVFAPGEAKTPFPPDSRLYARGSSDDKGTIVAMLAAMDAMKASGATPSVNLKILLDGEEEIGSPHLPAFLKDHPKTAEADLWLICDGPVHQSRRMQLVFGARGVTDVEITLYGPARALHSGHYGNFVPNPALELAHLLASMRDRDGRVLVDGYLDDVKPVSDAERKALAEFPDVDDELRASLGVGPADRGGFRLMEGVLQPAINVRGLASGQVGAKAANAIPTEAHASLDFRLVPDQTPAKVKERVEAHIRAQGYRIVTDAPDAQARREGRVVKLAWGSGYPPARTALDAPAARAVTGILDAAFAQPVLKLPSLGGSVPMYLFGSGLKAPALIFPIANHDNNQHAANENLRLQNLWDGIEAYAALFEHLGPALTEAEVEE